MKMAVFDFALRKKGYMVCYISLYYCCRCSWLSVSPSIHLRIFPFTRKLLIRRFNYGSVVFLFDLFWNFSYRKINYVICERTLFSCS